MTVFAHGTLQTISASAFIVLPEFSKLKRSNRSNNFQLSTFNFQLSKVGDGGNA